MANHTSSHWIWPPHHIHTPSLPISTNAHTLHSWHPTWYAQGQPPSRFKDHRCAQEQSPSCFKHHRCAQEQPPSRSKHHRCDQEQPPSRSKHHRCAQGQPSSRFKHHRCDQSYGAIEKAGGALKSFPSLLPSQESGAYTAPLS